jgi:hypothetical protein
MPVTTNAIPSPKPKPSFEIRESINKEAPAILPHIIHISREYIL